MPKRWFELLPQDGELAALVRDHDWTATPLGPPEQWPPALRTLLGVMLDSDQAMFLAWGPERTLIYNDAYAPMLAGRHPAALGRDFSQVWSEAWPELIPLFDSVFAGETVRMEDIQLTLERKGFSEEAHFAFFYTPVRDETGGVAGLFCGCTEITDRVFAERKRVAEADRLRALFQAAPSFVAILRGRELAYEFTNDAYLRLIAHRDPTGMTIRERVPELEGQGYFELFERVFDTGEPIVGLAQSVSLQMRPGAAPEERFVDFVFQPIRDDQGAVTGIFIEGSDITEGKRAQDELRERDAFLRLLLDSTEEAFYSVDTKGMTTLCNAAFLRMLRFEHEKEVLGRALHGVIHHSRPDGSAYPREACPIYRTASTGEPAHVDDELFFRRDGSSFPVEYRAHPIWRDGRLEGAICTFIDITERKRAEAAFRESSELNRGILESSGDCITVLDLDGVLRYVSPGGVAAMDVEDLDAIQGLPWRSAWPSLGRSHVDHALAEARAGRPSRFQALCRTLKGTPKWWDVSVAPMLDAKGRPERIVAVSRDITKERDAADALHRLNTTLEAQVEARTRELMHAEEQLRQAQKMEAVGQLTGGIAHDFNNLLQGILGSLNLVQKRIAAGRTGEVDRFITGAVTSANRAAALTHRLLAFSRRQPLDPKPVKANALVASMEDLLRRTLGEHIGLELVLAGGLWPTLCDPNQLESALLNLAINARDAMPDGGRLTIETCNAHLDSLYAARARDVTPGQYVCVCVTDTGGGMTPEVLERAFDPFFTTKPIGQGTGLGLSMIYGFARQSEGYAKIYSEVGQGTTVKLYLPRHRGSGAEAEVDEALPALTSAHQAEAGETVLVVEDEPVVRGLIVEVLHELGYRALEAADGPSGLEMLRNKARRIDLLVSDIGLPGLNGRQLADAARELRPELRVLFMTGYAENAAFASGFLDAGMAMITKPFAMEHLATRIREMIEEPRDRRS